MLSSLLKKSLGMQKESMKSFPRGVAAATAAVGVACVLMRPVHVAAFVPGHVQFPFAPAATGPSGSRVGKAAVSHEARRMSPQPTGSSKSTVRTGPASNSAKENSFRDAVYQITDSLTNTSDARLGQSVEKTWEGLGQVLLNFDDSFIHTVDKAGSPSPAPAWKAPPTQYFKKTAEEEAKEKAELRRIANAAAAAEKAAKEKAQARAVADSVSAALLKAEQEPRGVTDLQRPDKVQSVVDNIQKAAVKIYRESIPQKKNDGEAEAKAVAAAAVEGLMTALDQKARENELDALLKESSFKPNKMNEEGKASLVKAVGELRSTEPLKDPKLEGVYSLVYSSKKSAFRNWLGKKRSLLFKFSEPTQTVDVKTKEVVNECKVRLRLTPLRLKMRQKGTYTESRDGNDQVDVTFGRGKVAGLGLFKKGKFTAAVTYVGDHWRVCNADKCSMAFVRKE